MSDEQAAAPANSVVLAAQANEIIAATRDYVATQKARLMEVLWRLRRQFADDDEFTAFAGEHLDIKVDAALAHIAVWDESRYNRQLRELAQQKPDEAMRFIQDLTGGDALDVVRDEPEVARLLSLPPRKRTEAIRDLLAVKANGKHHPADLEEIKVLREERDAAVNALEKAQVTDLDSHPMRRLGSQVKKLLELQGRLTELSLESRALFDDLAGVALDSDGLREMLDTVADWRHQVTHQADALGQAWGALLGDES